MNTISVITAEQWQEQYKPITNPNPNAGWETGEEGGLLWETYGDEYRVVSLIPNEHVWTWVDTDNGTRLIQGRCFANRINYLITEVAWTPEQIIEVEVD
jgi:hypothetical protein